MESQVWLIYSIALLPLRIVMGASVDRYPFRKAFPLLSWVGMRKATQAGQQYDEAGQLVMTAR